MANVKKEKECIKYMEEHKLLQLFNNLISELIYNKPDNPNEFLIKKIKALIEKSETPVKKDDKSFGLFSEKNIYGMFEMLATPGQQYINLDQYTHGLTSLGAKEFNIFPLGFENDQISLEVFVEESRRALARAGKAYIDKIEQIETVETIEGGDEYLEDEEAGFDDLTLDDNLKSETETDDEI